MCSFSVAMEGDVLSIGGVVLALSVVVGGVLLVLVELVVFGDDVW